MLPTLLPPRMTRSLRRVPMVLALLLPVVAFLVIGRTSEISKAAADAADGSVPTIPEEVAAATNMIKRTFGLAGGSSAGAGIGTNMILSLARLTFSYPDHIPVTSPQYPSNSRRTASKQTRSVPPALSNFFRHYARLVSSIRSGTILPHCAAPGHHSNGHTHYIIRGIRPASSGRRLGQRRAHIPVHLGSRHK